MTEHSTAYSQKRHSIFKAMFLIHLMFSLSYSQNNSNGTLIDFRDDKLVDPRDNQRYRIIKEGNLFWMAENLNFKDYEAYLDSLFKDRYKTILGWCNAIEKDNFELKKHYLKENPKEDYFLKYYEERCVKPIKEFERSTNEIHYRYVESMKRTSECHTSPNGCIAPEVDIFYTSVVKTATGARAKYSLTGYANKHRQSNLEVELSEKEWFDFIKDLYRSGFLEWKKFETPGLIFKAEVDNARYWLSKRDTDWEFFVYSSNKKVVAYTGNRYSYYDVDGCIPQNWEEFNRAIDDINEKIKKKAGVDIEKYVPWYMR